MSIKIRQEKNWSNYLAKAGQFFVTARDAFQSGNWNAVGLNAVHAAISAGDAVTVYFEKFRSAGEKHSDAVKLLLEALPEDITAAGASKHLIWLINRKNLIEYESRLFREKEAEEALRHAERFLIWARNKIEK